MSSHSIPDWVSAVVGVFALAGVGVGVYAGVTNSLTEVKAIATAKHVEVDGRLTELNSYQTFLQGQVDSNVNRVTVLEVKTDAIERGQEKLSQSLDALTVELRTMNKILIKLDTIQGVSNAKEG